MNKIWATFIKKFIIFTALSVGTFYICLFSENEKILKCSKNTDTCHYLINTNINSTLHEKTSFKISEITSLEMRKEDRISRRRGRTRHHYRYLIDMFFVNGTKQVYPLHTESSSSQYTTFHKFSEYLRNNSQDSYYDYDKSDDLIWGIVVAIVFLLFSISSIFTLEKEIKEYKSKLSYAEITKSKKQVVITSEFFNDNWWKTAHIEDVEAKIANGASVKERNDEGNTPLIYAAFNNPYPEIIEMLVNLGANVNEYNHSGLTPLMYAAEWNPNPEITKTLVNLGANINEQNDNGTTILISASEENKNPEVIKTLVNLGADVNERDIFGNTPLMQAAEWNENPEIIRTLVELGADINVRDKFGKTSLMYAAENNENPEVVKILLELGADFDERDYAGRTAIIYATKNNNPDILKILTELIEHNEL